MATNINSIRGITPEIAAKMNERGIRNTDQLLEATQSAPGRRELAAAVGIEGSVLTELINRADLARLKGVGDAFANLLEEAGVDSLKELARRKPDNLHERLATLNAERKIANRVPTLEEVTGWVEEAKSLSKDAQD